MTKIYTRKGDNGETRIIGKGPMPKNNLYIITIGEIDELNSCLGFASVALEMHNVLMPLAKKTIRIQHELFNLGAQLSVLTKNRKSITPIIRKEHVAMLEYEIDEMSQLLPQLCAFILPGGCEEAARLHLARSVCRRAERALVSLKLQKIKLDGVEVPYLNRLSDWLFVAGRLVVYQLGFNEILWVPQKG